MRRDKGCAGVRGIECVRGRGRRLKAGLSRWSVGRWPRIVWQWDGRYVIRSRGRRGRRDKGCAGIRRVERVRGRGRRLKVGLSALNDREHCIQSILGTAYLAVAGRHWNDRREEGRGAP